MITFFAMLGNANEWADIEVFAKEKEKWLRKYLELAYGIPMDDTVRLILRSCLKITSTIHPKYAKVISSDQKSEIYS